MCYHIRVRNVTGDIDALHLHVGAAGHDGPVGVALPAPVQSGRIAACTSIGRDLARRIWTRPSHYYLNVHSTTYPDGAVRGQLRRA
jgi:hypothetical protein